MQQNPQTPGIGEQIFKGAVSLGIPAALWTVLDQILSTKELLTYRFSLIFLGFFILFFLNWRTATKLLKILCLFSLLIFVVFITTLYIHYSDRQKQIAVIESNTPPLNLVLRTSSPIDGRFNVELLLKNDADYIIELNSYAASNNYFGTYIDVEPRTIRINPTEMRAVSLGQFELNESFDLNVQLTFRDVEKPHLRAIKSFFSSVTQSQTVSSFSSRVLDASDVNLKDHFIATVTRTIPGSPAKARMIFNVTKNDTGEVGGTTQTPSTGRYISYQYAPHLQRFFMWCGSGQALPDRGPVSQTFPDNRIAETSLPLVILSDRFDQIVEMAWNYDERSCTLRVGDEIRKIKHPPPLAEPKTASAA